MVRGVVVVWVVVVGEDRASRRSVVGFVWAARPLLLLLLLVVVVVVEVVARTAPQRAVRTTGLG